MAKHTTRDQIWDAALQYAKEWEDKPPEDCRSRHGFTATELMTAHDIEASQKTVSDCLLTMVDLGWLRRTSSGRGGQSTTYSR